MKRRPENKRSSLPIAILALTASLLVVQPNHARSQQSNLTQVVLSNQDPRGDGESIFTVLYQQLPLQAQVGTNLTVPVKLYVDNLTKLMIFLQDYSVTLTLTFPSGQTVSGKAGVSANDAVNNLGALQLHAGQAWGPANITLPLTQAKTRLMQGSEAVVSATIRVDADVWFNQPIDFFRSESNQTSVGEMVIANGAPTGPALNYAGIGLLGAGLALVAVSLAMRERKQASFGGGRGGSEKPPGAV